MTPVEILMRKHGIEDTSAFRAFIDELSDEIYDVILNCDPSTKLVAHEPYREIATTVKDYFVKDEEADFE